MKLKLLIFTSLTSLSYAHDGAEKKHSHDHAPKPVIAQKVTTGNGTFSYVANATWGKMADNSKLGPTHGGIVVDSNGLVYISTDGPHSIVVFKADGTFVKKIAPEAKGTHHLAIAKEGDKEFLYAAHLRGKRVIKMDLDGNTVLEISEKTSGKVPGDYKGLTGVAVAPDGHVFVSMGYGSNMIHKFDKAGKLVKSFGGKGKELEKFTTPHTLSLDPRFEKPRLLICDREKRRLVHYDLDGNFIGVHASNLRRPCAVSFFGEFCAVAELEARAVVLDKSGTPISFLGDNPNKKQWAGFGVKPSEQKLGIFSAPHGLSFDKDGNLYVQDWNATGRATRLELIK